MWKRMHNLYRNIHFLSKYQLDDFKYDIMVDVYDNMKYEQCDGGVHVYSNIETIDLLLKSPKSFCRIGDGELELIMGHSIPFQKYDSNLADTLKRVLRNDNDKMYVGINYSFFNSTKNLPDLSRRFHFQFAKKYRDILLKYIDSKKEYISAGFNQVYMGLNDFDFDDYYLKVKQLFSNRELVIIAGSGVLSNIEYDVFELAKSKEYIFYKNTNAYDDYDDIIDRVMEMSPEKVILLILGPCSKALVYELSQKGRMVWDIGHLAKDYDWFMRNHGRSDRDIVDFYSPD